MLAGVTALHARRRGGLRSPPATPMCCAAPLLIAAAVFRGRPSVVALAQRVAGTVAPLHGRRRVGRRVAARCAPPSRRHERRPRERRPRRWVTVAQPGQPMRVCAVRRAVLASVKRRRAGRAWQLAGPRTAGWRSSIVCVRCQQQCTAVVSSASATAIPVCRCRWNAPELHARLRGTAGRAPRSRSTTSRPCHGE